MDKTPKNKKISRSLIQFPARVLDPLRKYLLHQQQKLLKQKEELRQEDPFTDVSRVDDNADIGKEAAEQWGHERVEVLKLEVDKMLINIRKALTRIKIGKYGLCERCSRMIDTDRLAINPTAGLCINCQRQPLEMPRKGFKAKSKSPPLPKKKIKVIGKKL